LLGFENHSSLPLHSTHLLQPLDIGIFAPLALAYKRRTQEFTRFQFNASIKKTDFIQIYCEARNDAIIEDNIKSSWLKAGLKPLDPEVVLRQIPTTLVLE
jgi:DDE superfamily endonuclease